MPRLRFGILFLLAFALRMVYCAATEGLGHFTGPDYAEYAVAAERLLAHGMLVSPLIVEDAALAPSALMPPGYTVLLAGLYWAFGVNTFLATL